MNEVPKFVRHRLPQHPTGEHLDANLLAAFAEGALAQRERAQVLEHLSACAACRETMSLALPEVPAATPAAVPGAKGWLRWPTLRWAGAAAAVVVVAAAVVMQKSRVTEPAPKIASYSETAPKPAESKPAEAAASIAETANAVKGRTEKERRADRDLGRAKTLSDQKKDALAGAMANAAPARVDQMIQSNEPAPSQVQNQVLAIPAAPVAKAQAPAATGGPISGGLAMEQSKQQAAQSTSQAMKMKDAAETAQQYEAVAVQKARAERAQQFTLDRQTVARAAAAPKPAGASGVGVKKAAMTAVAHWRVSSEGALERSGDAGQTWQIVRIDAPPTIFRSVSSVEGDLWAGGAGGALYHSPDSGRTWQRMTVKAGDATLESDITRVEFTDVQHGALTTAAGEIWATSDGGATWSVRR